MVSELDMVIPAADLYLCVMRIGNISGLSEKTKREAFELIFRIKGTEYAAGKNPMGLAAAAGYIACIKNSVCISQKQIAKAAAVTEVTLRSRMRELKAKKLV